MIYLQKKNLVNITKVLQKYSWWKAYAIPLYIDGTHLFYRADLLKKYGFEAPKTWEELIRQSKTILEGEKNPDLVGFVNMWAKIEDYLWIAHIFGAGGKFFDEQGKIAVNSPEGVNNADNGRYTS